MGQSPTHERYHQYHRLATCATEFLAIAIHMLSTLHIDIASLGTSVFAAYALATAAYLRLSLMLIKQTND